MKQDIENILISEEEIQKKVKELGATLTEEYSGKSTDVSKSLMIFTSPEETVELP